jgi:glycosyltransferase involved in cell wall biosynthesis
MRILFLAPHPFFQARGTPIAVDLLLNVLSKLGHQIDVVTFAEGEDRHYPNVHIYRAQSTIKVSGIRPGFSIKKLYCDWGLYRTARDLIRKKQYDLVHAVEEAAFLGLIFARRYGLPFIYDMDSSLSAQMANKSVLFSLLRPLLTRIEARPLKNALAVAPMCQDLADVAGQLRDPSSIFVIKDVSLLDAPGEGEDSVASTALRDIVKNDLPIVLYVGNLEKYQGIDLVLQAAQQLSLTQPVANFVFIGGVAEDIQKYRDMAEGLGIENFVYFLGPRPVEQLGTYLRQADILVSPRTQGTNTPMKIYSYLHSGIPTVATRLPTHTQVMNDDIAVLTEPDAAAFALALRSLLDDPEKRQLIGRQAREYAEKEHGHENFVASVTELYSFVEAQCATR